ncbi:MAG: SWIM zinc finger family protein [Candidatus Bathyarchaeia archaeon]
MVTKIKGVWVRVLEPGLLEVESCSQKGKFYVVDRFAKTCTCPDFKFRGRKCKHLAFVEENEWKVELEEKIWKANKEFMEEKRREILEKLKDFKPLDEKTRKEFRLVGWEYDEDLSALVWALIT